MPIVLEILSGVGIVIDGGRSRQERNMQNKSTKEDAEKRESERQAAMSADLLQIADSIRWRDQDTGARRQ